MANFTRKPSFLLTTTTFKKIMSEFTTTKGTHSTPSPKISTNYPDYVSNPNPRNIQIGEHCNEYFSSDNEEDAFLKPLRCSNRHCVDGDDWEGVRENLQSDGYVFLRELIDPSKIERARLHILNTFKESGGIIKNNER